MQLAKTNFTVATWTKPRTQASSTLQICKSPFLKRSHLENSGGSMLWPQRKGDLILVWTLGFDQVKLLSGKKAPLASWVIKLSSHLEAGKKICLGGCTPLEGHRAPQIHNRPCYGMACSRMTLKRQPSAKSPDQTKTQRSSSSQSSEAMTHLEKKKKVEKFGFHYCFFV